MSLFGSEPHSSSPAQRIFVFKQVGAFAACDPYEQTLLLQTCAPPPKRGCNGSRRYLEQREAQACRLPSSRVGIATRACRSRALSILGLPSRPASLKTVPAVPVGKARQTASGE